MKKFLAAALAASLIGAPAFAQPYDGHDHDRGRTEQQHQQHRGPDNNYRGHWNKGERFDWHRAQNYRVISNPRVYHLRPAPRGYHWVRSGNDAVLVGITTGIVAAVIASSIH